jgi:hypothetical protein
MKYDWMGVRKGGRGRSSMPITRDSYSMETNLIIYFQARFRCQQDAGEEKRIRIPPYAFAPLSLFICSFFLPIDKAPENESVLILTFLANEIIISAHNIFVIELDFFLFLTY